MIDFTLHISLEGFNLKKGALYSFGRLGEQASFYCLIIKKILKSLPPTTIYLSLLRERAVPIMQVVLAVLPEWLIQH